MLRFWNCWTHTNQRDFKPLADFHQNGNIATLHNLRTRDTEQMEQELELYASTRKISLILPCLYSELETEAMPRIREELSKVNYLHRVIIGLDRADETQFRKAKAFFKEMNQNHIVIWNDSPRSLALGARLEEMGLAPSEAGKGKNVWTSLGYLISCGDSAVMAIHDCDIITYSRDMLARLVYPVANPAFPYQVAKGYYPRTDGEKLNGRVTRLLISPLLIALKRVVGDRDYLDFLRSFRYLLSGEFAMRTAILPDLRIPSDWGLEVGVLSEAWRNLALAADGTVFTPNVFRTLKATYYRSALDLLEAYYNDAKMNGLAIDRHGEEKTIEVFADNIIRAGQIFLDNPHETPFIPTWNRIHSAAPGFLDDLHAAVAADDMDFD